MAEENERQNQGGGQTPSSSGGDGLKPSGDPGRTPGSAEGERETVEQDLRDKSGDDEQ